MSQLLAPRQGALAPAGGRQQAAAGRPHLQPRQQRLARLAVNAVRKDPGLQRMEAAVPR